jgi:hypothetical protein
MSPSEELDEHSGPIPPVNDEHPDNDLSDESSPDPTLLTLVRQCAIERDKWDLAYQQALQAARDAGFSGSQIAEAAGVSKQAVLRMTQRPGEES